MDSIKYRRYSHNTIRLLERKYRNEPIYVMDDGQFVTVGNFYKDDCGVRRYLLLEESPDIHKIAVHRDDYCCTT